MTTAAIIIIASAVVVLAILILKDLFYQKGYEKGANDTIEIFKRNK